MPFTAGYLSQSDADALNAAIAEALRLGRIIDSYMLPSEKEFPARITAFDAATQRASWSEEAFAADGSRYVKPGGRFGDTTQNPAYPVGNGLLPPPSFPFQVMLRERVIHTVSGTALGMAYEFDFSCYCAGSGSGASGSGGGSTGVLTSCCPSALPTTLTATLTQTSGTPCVIDGTAVTLTFSSTQWLGAFTTSGTTWTVSLSCSSSIWTLAVTSGGTCDFAGGTHPTIDSCNPLHLTATGATIPGGCGVCPGAAFTITITE